MTSSCEACRADAPVLENKEIQQLLSQIPSWRVFEEDDTKKIICSFVFLNYDDSRNFLNKVADLADEEDHHPFHDRLSKRLQTPYPTDVLDEDHDDEELTLLDRFV